MATKLNFPTGQSMSTKNPAKWPLVILSLVLTAVVVAFAWTFGRPIGASLANRTRNAAGMNADVASSPDTMSPAV